MNCAGCGAALRLDAVHQAMVCDFCRRFEHREPNADGVREFAAPSGAACPVCQAAMTLATVESSAIEYCPACRGMLITTEAFVRGIESLRVRIGVTMALPPADRQELHRRIGCPRCRRTMDTHFYSGPGHVVIDNCPECLVNFLDHNELRRIAVGWQPRDPPLRELVAVKEDSPKAPGEMGLLRVLRLLLGG
jgi:Zn-finger nucleic acid-binding protein